MSVAPHSHDRLDVSLAEHTRAPLQWSQPVEFNLANHDDRDALHQVIEQGGLTNVIDPVLSIAGELYEYENPGMKDDAVRRDKFVQNIVAEGNQYGRWFHMPWSGELIRYPEQNQHRALRTSRNRNLITDAEQDTLYDATVAVFGLSVGSKVVENLVSSGIGGRIIIGDPDIIEPTNLNRINGGFNAIGMGKIDHMAAKISEADPYIEQVHFREGVTPGNLRQLSELAPSIVFDEVDDLAMKASIRNFGSQTATPIVMATDLGDRSMLDVERYDTEAVEAFNGRLKPQQVEKLISGYFTEDEKAKYMLSIVGLRHVTTRMLGSVMEVDRTISGLPQLGATASIGGALASMAAREIILGHDLASGRYVFSPKQTLHLKPQATVREGLHTVAAFVKSKKER